MLRRTVMAGLVLMAAVVVAVSCTTNPATGKRIVNLMSTEDEIRLGSEAAPEFLKEYGGEVKSQELRNYVNQVGKKLARNSERPELPWEFHVPDSEVINAFALPGGKIFITRGLMSKLDNEAQLAGVLGHEVGHVTAQHVNQRMAQAAGVSILAAGVGVAGDMADSDLLRGLGVGAVQGGGTVYLLKFSRDQESEADALGVRYMTAQGYNPWGQVQMMKILEAEASGGRQLEFLSTHPYPETRIARLSELIESKYAGANDPDKYTFAADRYNRKALAPLKELPPPKKTTQSHNAIEHAALAGAGWCAVCNHTH